MNNRQTSRLDLFANPPPAAQQKYLFSDQLPNGCRLAPQESRSADEREPLRAYPDAEEAAASFAGLRPDLHEAVQNSGQEKRQELLQQPAVAES